MFKIKLSTKKEKVKEFNDKMKYVMITKDILEINIIAGPVNAILKSNNYKKMTII